MYLDVYVCTVYTTYTFSNLQMPYKEDDSAGGGLCVPVVDGLSHLTYCVSNHHYTLSDGICSSESSFVPSPYPSPAPPTASSLLRPFNPPCLIHPSPYLPPLLLLTSGKQEMFLLQTLSVLTSNTD